MTLAMFARLSTRVKPFFLNTVWNDGEFPRRLDALGIPHKETYFGMVSRKFNLRVMKWVLHGLVLLPLGWFDFIQIVRRFRPDVIYFAERHAVIQLFPLVVWMRRKVVFHIHDPAPAVAFQRASFAVWRRAVGRFIFISGSVRERTALLGRLGPRDIVVTNGVRVVPLSLPRQRAERFARQFGWSDDCLVVGITGQMTETKGHEDFLAAAKRCVAVNPRLRFVIGGKPLEPFATRLRELAREPALCGVVGFAGWLPTSQEFFEAVDILVLASRHDEGFGLVIAEAMERGVAVVSTRSGGAVEIIEHGVSGFLIEKRAPEKLAACLLSLAADDSLRLRVAAAGRKRVEQFFNLERQAVLFEEVLRYAD
ncbi:MAG TPA: glycosyltransferase family 4 protein [Bryobacteraceae bacterium]|nr:glycosyltransferase family 4 protein [Bryobacteraceae bacterium]